MSDDYFVKFISDKFNSRSQQCALDLSYLLRPAPYFNYKRSWSQKLSYWALVFALKSIDFYFLKRVWSILRIYYKQTYFWIQSVDFWEKIKNSQYSSQYSSNIYIIFIYNLQYRSAAFYIRASLSWFLQILATSCFSSKKIKDLFQWCYFEFQQMYSQWQLLKYLSHQKTRFFNVDKLCTLKIVGR